MPDYDTTKWAPVNAPAATSYDTTKWAPVDEAGAALGKVPAQMSQAPGLGARALDEGERILGYGAGAGLGVEGGPVGAAAGGGIGATAADIDIAKRHHDKYGTPIDLSPGNVAKDAALNVAGGYGGEKVVGLAGKVLGGALGMARGEPELAAGARAAANQVEAPGKDFAAKQTDIQRETSDQLGKLRSDTAKKITPDAQQAMVQQSTGRAPAATQAATMQAPEAGTALPGPGQVGRAQRFYSDITSPLKRASDTWAAKRDNLMGPFMDQRVDSAPLMAAINEENQYAQANAKSFSPAIQKLFSNAGNLGAPDPLAGKYSPEELAQMAPNVRKNLTEAVQKMNMAQPRGAGTVESYRASTSPMLQPQAPTGPSVRELLGMRSEASRLADAASSASDRHAASSVADAVDETLTQIDAPSLKPLNAQYRSFKTLFPRQFGRTISSAAEPVDTAPAIFDQPQRAMNLLSGAQPEERQTLRTLYADWVNRDGPKVIKQEHAPVLAKMFPGTPLGTPEGFSRVTSSELGVEEVLKSSPEVQQKFMQAYLPAARAEVIKGMQQTTREAIQQARKMGPLGQQIVERIESSTDPAEQFKIAVKAITGVTPDQAGTAAIQAGATGKTGGASYILQRARIMAPLYLAIGGPALASGHISYPGIMAILGVTMGVGEFAKRAFYKSLENPEAAANYWRALTNPAAPGALATIARQAAVASMSDAIGATGKAATGVTLEKEPDNSPTPMTKAYDRATAQQASGKGSNPSRTDHLEKLTRDLRKSKTPDVAAGLRTGRLSMPAVKQLLKQQNQKTAPALLSHLGPADIKHLLALASPEERAWLEPLAAQRLGNG